MFLVGLTGGIGTGKSTVSGRLAQLGAAVVDLDAIARSVVEPGRPAWRALREAFGQRYFSEDGSLDRESIGQLIFGDAAERTKLNRILHPFIRSEMMWQLIRLALSGEQFVVIDAPLLFETQLNRLMQKTVVVFCSADQQAQRVADRDKRDVQSARQRMNSQTFPMEQKKRLATFLIDNGDSKEATFAQMTNGEDVEELLRQFYECTDATVRKQLDERLVAFQRSADAWPRLPQLFVDGAPDYVQLFGASCLYEQLKRRHSDWLSSAQALSNVQSVAVGACESRSVCRAARAKAASAVALLILHTMPDVWPDALGDLSRRWAQTDSPTLVQVVAALPDEMADFAAPVQQRGVVRACLARCAVDDVVPLLGRLLGDAATPRQLVSAAIDCLVCWIRPSGAVLSPWRDVILLALGKITNDEHRTDASRLLECVARHEDLARVDSFGSQIVHTCAAYVEQSLWPALLRSSWTVDDDELSLLYAIADLATSQSRLFLHGLESADAATAKFVDFLLHVSSAPGSFPVDEQASAACHGVWPAIEEEVSSRSDQPTDVVEHRRALLRPLYSALLVAAIRKLCFTAQLAGSSAAEKEEFEQYRSDWGETLISCHRLLGEDALAALVDASDRSLAAERADAAEAAVFAIDAFADYLGGASGSLGRLVVDVLPRVGFGERSSGTTARLLDKLAHVLTTSEERAVLAPAAVRCLLAILQCRGVDTTPLFALDHLLGERIVEFAPIVDEAMAVCAAIFAGEANAPACRLRALRCVGALLSLRPSADILNSLDGLLAPRLQRLDSLCRSVDAPTMTKADVLFELSIVSTLVGTLERPQQTVDDGSGASPVLLVLEMSVRLFERLLESSGNDCEVAAKLCETLRHGVGALLDRAAPLVADCCRLLSRMLPSTENVFGVARQLFLLFAADAAHAPLLAATLVSWAQSFAAADAVDVHVLDEYLNFAVYLARKKPAFLYDGDARAAVSPMVNTASRTVTTVAEGAPVKSAALLLATVVSGADEWPAAAEVVAQRGESLTRAAFTRLLREPTAAAADACADLLFVLVRRFPAATRVCLSDVSVSAESLSLLLNEQSSKRKFRQLAKQICRDAQRHC